MKRMMLLAALLVAPLAQGQTTTAQEARPFGLRMGMTTAELVRLGAVRSESGYYLMERPPTPNAEFVLYRLTVSERHGLCAVAAFGQPVATTPNGASFKARFASLETALNRIYGEGEHVSEVNRGSVYTSDSLFLAGLRQEERRHFTYWDDSVDGVRLPRNLAAISLESYVPSTASNIAFVLYYDFSNWERCEEERSSGL